MLGTVLTDGLVMLFLAMVVVLGLFTHGNRDSLTFAGHDLDID